MPVSIVEACQDIEGLSKLNSSCIVSLEFRESIERFLFDSIGLIALSGHRNQGGCLFKSNLL
jgi:hypothetical protein